MPPSHGSISDKLQKTKRQENRIRRRLQPILFSLAVDYGLNSQFHLFTLPECTTEIRLRKAHLQPTPPRTPFPKSPNLPPSIPSRSSFPFPLSIPTFHSQFLQFLLPMPRYQSQCVYTPRKGRTRFGGASPICKTSSYLPDHTFLHAQKLSQIHEIAQKSPRHAGMAQCPGFQNARHVAHNDRGRNCSLEV